MKLRILPKMLLFILVPAILGMAILSFSARDIATNGMTRQIDENLERFVFETRNVSKQNALK